MLHKAVALTSAPPPQLASPPTAKFVHSLLGINAKAVSTQALKNVADREQVPMELLALTSSRPFFICLMIVLQTVVFASAMFEAIELEAFARFELDAAYEPCIGDDCPLKFDGTPDDGAVQVEETNPW